MRSERTNGVGRDDHVAGEWGRDRWLAYADELLAGARAWASPTGARITPPGAAGGYGRDVDGLEGFARTFLLAGFRIAGAGRVGLDDLVECYTRGVRAGVDPANAERWVRLDEHPQAKVEAASIAVSLDLTRPWIWDHLDAVTRRRVVDYLAPAVGDDSYPPSNWLWFRIVVETFLRSVGGPWSMQDIADDLARHDSFVRDDGWLSDGEHRAFDHYVGWALHVYPVLWARMQGAAELAAGRTAGDIARLDRFLLDAIALVGGDGSPLIQGRSLVYRFAAAAPFWAGALAGVPSLSPGLLRHAAARVVGHFADRGVPDRGVLTLGWHHAWRRLAQSYSGPGSPYWAVKGLLGIALPPDHPAWTAPAEPLPVDTGDDLRAVRAAGWLVSGTSTDGIVRVVNHGTDRALAGSLVGDSPLYARIGYSTATSPLLDDRAWVEPLEQSVALVDGYGRATHRAAMELLDVRVDDGVGIAASTWDAHWLTPRRTQQRHGSGLAGDVEIAGRLTVQSVVRGPWEVRLVCVESLSPDIVADRLRLRVGGWAVAGDAPSTSIAQHGPAAAHATAGGVESSISAALGTATAAVVTRDDASPLGAVAAVPVLEFAVAVGTWSAAVVGLTATDADAGDIGDRADGGQRGADAAVELIADEPSGGLVAKVAWPDGHVTARHLLHRPSGQQSPSKEQT